MTITIYLLDGPNPVGEPVNRRSCTIGVQQDTGTKYRLFIGNIPLEVNTKAELIDYLIEREAEYYGLALAGGAVMNLYTDVPMKRLFQGLAVVECDHINTAITRHNQLRTAFVANTTYTALRTVVENSQPLPLLTPSDVLDGLLEWLAIN